MIIDNQKCTNCKLCAQVCLLHNFVEDLNGKVVYDSSAECINCGHCVAVCPFNAISSQDITTIPDESSEHINYNQLLGFLRYRRSRREFTAQEVSDEIIHQLLNAASTAPNALNKQKVFYTFIKDKQIIGKISQAGLKSVKMMASMIKNPIIGAMMSLFAKSISSEFKDLLPEIEIIIKESKAGRDVVLYNAPCVIIVHTPKADSTGAENAIYAASNIALAAETLGLGTCAIGFVTEPARHNPTFKIIAGIPKNHTIHTTLIIGYPKFKYEQQVVRKVSKDNYKII